jgi:RNA polymerase sigma-70 factor (ECF subfamily)
MTMISASQSRQEDFLRETLPHTDVLYRLALGFSRDGAQAEDWVQETFLKAYRAWDSFEKDTNVRAWLMTILRNTVTDAFRRERRIDVRDLAEAESYSIFGGRQEIDPEGRFFAQLVDEEVLNAIRELPLEFREALLLRDVEDLGYAEIAELTGVAIGTVKSRLFRARRALQGQLYDYAVDMGYIRARDARPAASAGGSASPDGTAEAGRHSDRSAATGSNRLARRAGT